MVSAYDVCDVNRLYDSQSGFQFSLDRPLLESYLSGNSFDYKTEYTADELAREKADIRDIFQKIIAQNPVKEQVAIITCGAPGAGKTTLIKQDRQKAFESGRSIAYVCPDDVCLQGQERTYKSEVKSLGLKEAYRKWRPASNAANQLILGNLVREGYAFYFGSTSTSPFTYKFFQFLKDKGYRIKLIHLSSDDSVRWESITTRDKEFVQTSEADIVSKGKTVPERIRDTYLKYADEIAFYFRPNVASDAIHAATWIKTSAANEAVMGQLEIKDRQSYDAVVRVHNAGCKALAKEELSWDKTVIASSIQK